jgi:holliday junction DNA helicase RuvA
MIGRLVGNLVTDDVDGAILLDVAGVGYQVTVPLGAVGRARRASPAEVLTLFIHTHVRQDTLELYGFPSEQERQVFRLLIGLPGVGPKLGLAVLSALPPAELALAVRSGDLARLNKIQGVGKRTAERLVLELKEKLPKLGIGMVRDGGAEGTRVDDEARLLSALTNMGYKSVEAKMAVTQLASRVGKEPISDLLRAALAELAS